MSNADDLQRMLSKVKDGTVVQFNAPSEIKLPSGGTVYGKDVVYTGVVKLVHPYHYTIVAGVKEHFVPRASILSVGV